MHRSSTVVLATAVSFVATGAAVAVPQSESPAAQLAELKKQVAELKKSSGSWLTEERASEIRAIVTDVLADAQMRASLQGAAGAGYDGGFFLSSADGNFSMKLNVLEQIRWSFNDNDFNAPVGGGGGGGGGGVALFGFRGTVLDDTHQAHGFENKRTRLTIGGNVVDASWSYRLAYQLGYSNSTESFGAGDLSDAFVAKALECGATVSVGQFRLPYSAEYAIDAGNLQFMDYSVLESAFGAGYGQGVKVGYENDAFRVGVAYVNAIDSANDAWGATSPEAEWAFAGRVDAKVAGNWSQFDRGQSWRGDGYGVKVGAGLAWERANADPARTDTGLTVDATVNFGGASLAAAYFMQWTEDSGSVAVDDATPSGFLVSGGVFVTDDLELVARYEYADADQDLAGAENFSTLTVGGNWYLSKNTAKVGLDFGYAFDAVSAVYAAEAASNNWLLDPTGEDGQWVLRTQLSLSF
ncbi:MAG: porin [Phycisphaerales bacterium]